jgi:hypothetical protein
MTSHHSVTELLHSGTALPARIVRAFLRGAVSTGSIAGVRDELGITLGTGVGGALWIRVLAKRLAWARLRLVDLQIHAFGAMCLVTEQSRRTILLRDEHAQHVPASIQAP